MNASRVSWIFLAISGLVACGDDTVTDGGSGGTGGQGGNGTGAGGEGAGTADPASIVSAHAPDETTVIVQLEGDLSETPDSPNEWSIRSLKGEIAVGDVAYDAEANTITLVTAEQKLGIEYTVQVTSAGHPLDLQTAEFLSADTAKFWAYDFETGATFEVVADRVGVGENVVLYTTPDAPADDVDETIAIFDEQIFPTETDLLHAPPDRDDNGKILLLGLNGKGYYGGYFFPLDTLKDDEVPPGAHSNEMEMLYISTVDLGGSFGAEIVVAHEFGHLLYNEEHDILTGEYWDYHDEGLAECAVHEVFGVNEYANFYYTDPGSTIGEGLSLVRWTYSDYNHYAQAYVFLTYAASRLGGIDGYVDMFKTDGSPAEMSDLFQAQLGQSFSEVQLDMLTAVWLREPTGNYGFNGMLELNPERPTEPSTTIQPQPLEAFEGTIFQVSGNALEVTGAGTGVVHRSINAAGDVDDTAPYDAQGGVIIALNTNQDAADETEESSGTFGAGVQRSAQLSSSPAIPGPVRIARPHAGNDRTWLHPPPPNAGGNKAFKRWRKAVHGF